MYVDGRMVQVTAVELDYAILILDQYHTDEQREVIRGLLAKLRKVKEDLYDTQADDRKR